MKVDATKGWSDSLVVWLVMVLYVAPLLLAWNLWDPLDRLPYLECFMVGAAVSLGVWRFSALPSDAWQRRVRLVTICWAPCLLIGLGLAANRLFDASGGVTHDAVFLGYHSPHKAPSYVRLTSWREARPEERLTCNAGQRELRCPMLAPGAAVAVTTRGGALGWEWVESVVAR